MQPTLPSHEPQRGKRPPTSKRGIWIDRLLGLCPIAIAVLWIAGVTRFRGHDLETVEWLTLIAAGFAMHIVTSRISRRRPLPQLPEGARATQLAGLIATIIGVITCVIGGVLEFVAQNYVVSEVPWGLRMLWHAACAAGAAYCAFLRRLLRVLPA